MTTTAFLKKLGETYPFMTVCSYADVQYVGIVQNSDSFVTTFYDYGAINNPEYKKLFLELGSKWWAGSNGDIPISSYLKTDWDIFFPYLKSFNNKSLEVVHGPVCNITANYVHQPTNRVITPLRHRRFKPS